ncbi:ABC transporter permease [Methylophilaceae bacterium]|nr:ABC transporter permease [Methylophilaceae bacterium]
MYKKIISVSYILAWQDVLLRYKRTKVGAFWLTFNISVMITVLSFIFGSLLSQPASTFVPFIALGFIFWNFITSTIDDSCEAYVSSGDIILQINLPLSVHIYRVVIKNIIILLHNIIIIPLIYIIFGNGINLTDFLFSILGFILISLNLTWISFLVAIVCLRYRDLMVIIKNFMFVSFYFTPILWSIEMMPSQLNESFVMLNPFYNLIDVVRTPLLSKSVNLSSYYYSVILFLLGTITAYYFYKKYNNRVAYWI